MRRRPTLLIVVLLCGLAPRGSAVQWHEDQRYGFKLRPPKGWTQIPLQSNERWLVAKYLSDKTYIYNDEQFGWSWEHKPELMVIAFVEEAIRRGNEQAEELERLAREAREREARETGEAGEAADGDDPPAVERPYQGYEDFLERSHPGRGCYVTAREHSAEAGVQVTRYEARIEPRGLTGPKLLFAWVFHAAGLDLALQFEVLENAQDKLKSTVRSTVRTFGLIERSGELPGAAAEASGYVSRRAMESGTPEERLQRRQAAERALHERALAGLTEGWKSFEARSVLVLYDCDADYARRVADHCDAVIAWLAGELSHLGRDEYVRRPLLRVCASEAEKESLNRGAHSSDVWWFAWDQEIVTCKSEYGWAGWEIDSVNGRLLDQWLRERAADLWLAMPTWISHGLREYVGGARLSGRKLQFRDYQRDLVEYKVARSQGKTLPVRELLQLTRAEFWQQGEDWEDVWNRMAQADTFVRFLLSKEASRNRLARDLLTDYVANLREVIAALEAEDVAAHPELAGEPQSEAEERRLEERRHELRSEPERERQIIQRCFTRTFGEWGEREWSLLEKAFEAYTG